MDILDDMRVRKLSAKVFLKVNYSFNEVFLIQNISMSIMEITFILRILECGNEETRQIKGSLR